jgi:hypothetical protein
MILGLKSLPTYAQPDELLRRQHQVQASPPHLDGVVQRLLRGQALQRAAALSHLHDLRWIYERELAWQRRL